MLKYLIIIEKTASGFSAYVPDLPGCVASANTKKAIELNIYEAIKFHIEGLKKDGLKAPKSTTESEMVIFAA